MISTAVVDLQPDTSTSLECSSESLNESLLENQHENEPQNENEVENGVKGRGKIAFILDDEIEKELK